MLISFCFAQLLCYAVVATSAFIFPSHRDESVQTLIPAALQLDGSSSQSSTSRSIDTLSPQLRFDLAQEEQVTDNAQSQQTLLSKSECRFIYKLNRKRVSETKVSDAATLWSIRRVAVKRRNARLSDSTRREKVQLLKFFVEHKRSKAVHPHLLGNVGGCGWSASSIYDPKLHEVRKISPYIINYTLRGEFDTTYYCRGRDTLWRLTPHWRELGPRAVYILDGDRVPSQLFGFCEGLILQTLEIHTDTASMRRYNAPEGVVLGKLYPDRQPMVMLNGNRTTVAEWLKIGRSGAFGMDAAVPMYYYYMQPLEAVQLYGRPGAYGAIVISYAE